uniref:Pentacotripeptide-repeat region of PRORP domain-containing protein n=1 Tax=Eucampia antarctica TaxID=49252 RepID=A0A7S2S7H3_9STRA|mmetsp:Transcript_4085/g.3870  ORF Transcript_4085/g.3870 Transcript_4085/m.3870 type:complete len:448 (+) Transcript_4085:59-1402(+)|eukprot:CAMPEP_0197831094 /NCGR_PEP_ID=MMETSP1437-20131217/7687_1 /TAXON_ID=49252 ORGANISM="Eucampia antarctica, Strain CCMP1452" /NCGR_SAMPLE_ID=MMETSP1437 /ASSEMBLY_ACC=CAM_ASM_001096 /LENGTH=447 /DNA_ID=CAMNT_0043433861 /DNA_START=46 /DNA_END=1389 /DNA_ORIENTATION=+
MTMGFYGHSNCLLLVVILIVSSWTVEKGIVVVAFSTRISSSQSLNNSHNNNNNRFHQESQSKISRRSSNNDNNGNYWEETTINKNSKSKSSPNQKKKKLKKKGAGNNNNKKNKKDTGEKFTPNEGIEAGVVKQTTLPGGSSLIFGMARRMLVWQGQNVYNDSTKQSTRTQQQSSGNKIKPRVLPRWHPHAGISDINPSFRLSSPVMNNRGYAGVLRRNSRKRNKPSLYRYALRTYDKMRQLETENKGKLSIQRSSTHHLSALVACSKLGQWKESLRIYNEIIQSSKDGKKSISESMIHAIIRCCVRSSKILYRQKSPQYQEPLDAARDILACMTEKYDILVTSVHVNPLAAAYMYVQLPQQAIDVIESHLHHPVSNTNQYEVNESIDIFQIEDFQARDVGTYNIQICHAVSESNWEGAIQQLYQMNEVGLNPSTKQLNKWSDIHHYN